MSKLKVSFEALASEQPQRENDEVSLESEALDLLVNLSHYGIAGSPALQSSLGVEDRSEDDPEDVQVSDESIGRAVKRFFRTWGHNWRDMKDQENDKGLYVGARVDKYTERAKEVRREFENVGYDEKVLIDLVYMPNVFYIQAENKWIKDVAGELQKELPFFEYAVKDFQKSLAKSIDEFTKLFKNVKYKDQNTFNESLKAVTRMKAPRFLFDKKYTGSAGRFMDLSVDQDNARPHVILTSGASNKIRGNSKAEFTKGDIKTILDGCDKILSIASEQKDIWADLDTALDELIVKGGEVFSKAQENDIDPKLSPNFDMTLGLATEAIDIAIYFGWTVVGAYMRIILGLLSLSQRYIKEVNS